jgi:hypothetical protein
MNKNLQNNMNEAAETAQEPMLSQTLVALKEKTDALFGILLKPEVLELPEELLAVVVKTIQTAWSDAFSSVFSTGLIFVTVGVLAALFVGDSKIKRDKDIEAERQQQENNSELNPASDN